MIHIRWQGGVCSDLGVQLLPGMADRMRYPAVLVDRVRELAQSLSDAQIVDQLNQEGRVSAAGKAFTISMIKWIRYVYKIPTAKLKHPDELTVRQVAERFRVNPNVVYYWIEHSMIQARRLKSGAPYWISISESDEQKLRDWVRKSRKIQTLS